MTTTKTESRIRRFAAITAMVLALAALTMMGCSSSNTSSQTSSQAANLEGQQLDIYCGAGMTEPFQKIADLFTEQTGCEMNAGVITTTTTAPQIATALANGEGDAGIVWKENVKGDGVSIVDTTDLDALVKVIPAAQLTSAQDVAAVNAFKEFLQTDAVWDIWASYGYERA